MLELSASTQSLQIKIAESPTAEFLQTLCSFSGAAKGVVFQLLPEKPLKIEQYYPQGDSIKKETWLRQLTKAQADCSIYFPVEDTDSNYYGQQSNNLIAIISCAQKLQFIALYLKSCNSAAVSLFLERVRCFIAARQLPLRQQCIKEQQDSIQSLKFAVQLHNRLLKIKHFSDAGTIICRELAQCYNAEETFFGLCRRQRQVRVCASNFQRHINHQSPEAASIAELMEECCDQDLEILFPPLADNHVICHQHRLFSRSREGISILCAPLRNEKQQVVGCICILRRQAFAFEDCRLLRNTIDTITPFLDDLRNSSLWRRLLVRTPLRLLRPLFSQSFLEFKLASLVA
ncbi:MAG: hypothetical protein HRT88_07150, partial [Lentisphaeraceae bacterium]|nr:hypothetical protein [Lentisphaeraceae bacterium]